MPELFIPGPADAMLGIAAVPKDCGNGMLEVATSLRTSVWL
jgi:hypothetical protein